MSNAFRGQTQYQQSPMNFGGYGVGGLGGNSYAQLGGGMGGYSGYGYGGDPYSGFGGFGGGYGGGFGSPFSSSLGGYGGGYSQPSLVPQYQPTINDAFSRYFSQQYYGGPAFDPFAATSFFGGGFGGGFGFGGGGGRRGGMGGRMRRRRQMFEDLFGQQQPVAQPAPALPEPMPAQNDLIMYAGGSPGFYSQQQPVMQELPQQAPELPPQLPPTIDFSPIQRMGAVPMIYGGSFF